MRESMTGIQDERSALRARRELVQDVQIRRDDPAAVPRTDAIQEDPDQRGGPDCETGVP
jgi:hypothetical protein